MTFWRALKLGLLALAAVLVVVMIAGCSEVPEEVRRADACRTYERVYRTMNAYDRAQTLGVYLLGEVKACERDGFL